MGEKKLVTFNLDEERKAVWEEEADEQGRSLSGFIRQSAEKEIAGEHDSGGGTDHTEELSEIHDMLRGLTLSVDGLDDTLGVVHDEITIPDDTKENIPEVVSSLPKQEHGGMTPEAIREEVGMTELRIIQCLNHAEEQTGIVGRDTDSDKGVERFYRRV